MLYLPCAGVLWPSVDTHCARTLGQSTDSTLTVSFILRSFRHLSITSGPAFQQPPPLHKKQIRLPPPEMPGDRYPWQQPNCAGWGVSFSFLFLRVDSDDFTATSSHQEDSVETLEENLQELHVVLVSSSVPRRSGHVE